MSNESTEVVSCYCLRNEKGNLHCPLSTDKQFLERTFNVFVRGEEIVRVDIDKAFRCDEKRSPSCKNCPFA